MATKHTAGKMSAEGCALYIGNIKVAQCLDADCADTFGEAVGPRAEWFHLLPNAETAAVNAQRLADRWNNGIPSAAVSDMQAHAKAEADALRARVAALEKLLAGADKLLDAVNEHRPFGEPGATVRRWIKDALGKVPA